MLAERLADARNQTDALFKILDPSALYDRPVAERHRIVFYLGHLEAFDSNLLSGGPHSEMDKLFAFGIDPVGTGLPTDQPSDWPTIEEVRAYVGQRRAAVDQTPIDEQLWNVAIEHRLMHAETLAYMLHQVHVDKKIRQAQAEAPAKIAAPATLTVPSGTVTLGRSEGFGWDNEFDAHEVSIYVRDRPVQSVERRLSEVCSGGRL